MLAPRQGLDDPIQRTRAHVSLVVVQVSFGLFPLFGTLAMRELSPWAVACWRLGAGALVLGVLAGAVHGPRELLPARGDLGRIFLCSFLGIAANQGLFLAGLERSTATQAGLLMCLIPVFTFGAAALLGQERLELRRGAGVALALVAAAGWYLLEEPLQVSRYALGNGLIVANTLCYAFYLVLLRPLARQRSALVLLAWMYAASALLLPIALPFVELVPAGVSTAGWLSLTYVLIFPTLVGFLLNLYALARLRASTTAVYVYLQPLIAAGSGALWLGERPTPALAVSALGIFAGIWLVARRGAVPAVILPLAEAAPDPELPRGAPDGPRPS